MLIYQPKPRRLTAAETKTFIGRLNQSHVKDLRLVYEGVYLFCHNENDVVTLQLDEEGNTAYEHFLDSIALTLNKQWSEHLDTDHEDVSKNDRHVLRIAAVLHVFYDQLNKRLDRLPASPPPAVVKLRTLKQAIALTHYFTEQRKVLDQLGIGNENAREEATQSMASKLLTCCGPFVTVRLAQSLFNGNKRPLASTMVEVMENLKKDDLGTLSLVERTTVFFKRLPCYVEDEALAIYGVDPIKYKDQLKERAPHTNISKELFNKILRKSPDKDELESIYAIVAEED